MKTKVRKTDSYNRKFEHDIRLFFAKHLYKRTSQIDWSKENLLRVQIDKNGDIRIALADDHRTYILLENK